MTNNVDEMLNSVSDSVLHDYRFMLCRPPVGAGHKGEADRRIRYGGFFPLHVFGMAGARKIAVSEATADPLSSTAGSGIRLSGISKLTLAGLLFSLLLTRLSRRNYHQLKRIFDIVGSIIIMSFCAPVLLAAAVLIKLDSPGPVLIRQVRVGVNRRKCASPFLPRNAERRTRESLGSLFVIYKLRTMRPDAESKTGPVWARENDNRVTRIGNILRKSHLDELPQFINVLKGEMCIIGPRPERPIFINQLNDLIKNYDKRLEVKPGITGLAQVRYRYAASIEDARIKLRYDLLYINKMSLSLDIGILANTLNTVVSAKGAR